MNNMRVVILKIWLPSGELYAGMAMNANGGALSWGNVDGVQIDRITIEADNWEGQFEQQKEPRRKK